VTVLQGRYGYEKERAETALNKYADAMTS